MRYGVSEYIDRNVVKNVHEPLWVVHSVTVKQFDMYTSDYR